MQRARPTAAAVEGVTMLEAGTGGDGATLTIRYRAKLKRWRVPIAWTSSTR